MKSMKEIRMKKKEEEIYELKDVYRSGIHTKLVYIVYDLLDA